ncbi:MAG: hypothetical protein HZA20_04105 [Nitrospirae bacterium]|nr:hypothetical protein [Nitrospirota bacterium]
MKVAVSDNLQIADAVAELVEHLHIKYPGIRTKPVPSIEDEDFALEVEVPDSYELDTVEVECHLECIALEDKYGVYILPLVKQHRF